MKTLKITIILCLFSLSALYAQTDNRLEKALKPAIADLEKAEKAADLMPIVNKLERISQAEAAEWLPTYYLGYAYLTMAMKSGGKESAQYLEMSQKQLDKLMEMQPNNSEVVALQGFKHMIYMAQDPASRGQEYAPKTIATFQKAIALDPANPRANLLMAQMQYGTAEFFKTSTAEACGMIQKSLELFENQEKDTIAPSWGKEMALYYVNKCEEGQAKKE